MSFASRVLEVLRTEGLRGLWWRGLGVTAYRRLVVVAKPLEPAGARGAPREGDPRLTVEMLGPETVGDFCGLRPDIPAAEVERRLAAGQRCLLLRRDATVVSARWFSTEIAEVEYLDLAYELPDGVAYVFDSYTAPAARRLGLAAVRDHEALLRAEGCGLLLAATMPENTGGRALVGAAGYEPIGTIGVLRLGPLRLPRTRVAGDRIGRPRRLRAAPAAR